MVPATQAWMVCGMHAALFAELQSDQPPRELQAQFKGRYRGEPFVGVIPSVIDNLAGGTQAEGDMNIVFGLSETQGLESPALLP